MKQNIRKPNSAKRSTACLLLALLCAGCAKGQDVPIAPEQAPPPSPPGAAESAAATDAPAAYANITVDVRREGQDAPTRACTNPEDARLVSDIVFDYLVKSAAWEGVEASELENYIRLSFDEAGVSERQCFYQYDVEGRHVLQAGEAGRYCIMGDGAYAKLLLLAGLDAELREAPPDEQAAQEGAYQLITAKEAKAIMDGEADFVLLDVRTEEEFAEKHIPGALLIPDYELAARAASELPDINAQILVYCRSGRRSEAAAEALADMGYTNVKDFGGIINWPYDTVAGP